MKQYLCRKALTTLASELLLLTLLLPSPFLRANHTRCLVCIFETPPDVNVCQNVQDGSNFDKRTSTILSGSFGSSITVKLTLINYSFANPSAPSLCIPRTHRYAHPDYWNTPTWPKTIEDSGLDIGGKREAEGIETLYSFGLGCIAVPT